MAPRTSTRADTESGAGRASNDVEVPILAPTSPTILSQVAYPGPSKDDLDLANATRDAGPQQYPITIEDIVEGFRDFGRDVSASKMLTMLLRALAKDESGTFLEWLFWDRFKDSPPGDGMGPW
jgi:hypothetical protein